jgi:hypothetical protein
MKKLLLVFAVLGFTINAASQAVMYEINNTAFFDSNNDNIQDEEGIKQRIEYLYRLGISTIMLGENYLPGLTSNIYDKSKLPESYTALVNTLKKRGFKVYQSVDVLSVTDAHPWYVQSVGNPSSPYSAYILYADKQNKQPVQTANGRIAINLKNALVKEYFINLFTGFDSGLNGYRFIQSASSAGLNKEFWNPLTDGLKKAKPGIEIFIMPDKNIAVKTALGNTKADKIYASALSNAVVSNNKDAVIKIADSIFKANPVPEPVISLNEVPENVKEGQLRAWAAVNILLGGLPSVKAGQEYYGEQDNTVFVWKSPAKRSEREAWLKEKSAGWEEQQKKEFSLWSFYKELVSVRRKFPSIGIGTYKNVENSAPQVITFTRDAGTDKAFVMINLSGKEQEVTITDYSVNLDALLLVMGSANYNFKKAGRTVVLPPYWVQVWRVMK